MCLSIRFLPEARSRARFAAALALLVAAVPSFGFADPLRATPADGFFLAGFFGILFVDGFLTTRFGLDAAFFLRRFGLADFTVAVVFFCPLTTRLVDFGVLSCLSRLLNRSSVSANSCSFFRVAALPCAGRPRRGDCFPRASRS
jgi:hypothetical protein